MSLLGSSWQTGASTPERLDPVMQLERELTDEDRQLIEWMGEQIVSRRLTAAALFFLESVKPLNFVSSQFLVILSPLLGVFIPKVKYDRLVALLEKRPFIELLLRSMEAKEEEFLSQQRALKAEARAKKKASTSPQ